MCMCAYVCKLGSQNRNDDSAGNYIVCNSMKFSCSMLGIQLIGSY